MPGLFRNRPETREGKYPVLLRRDGTVPEWEHFCLGQRDPAAPTAIRAYADECERQGMDPIYVADLRKMAGEWDKSQAYEAAAWVRWQNAGPSAADAAAAVGFFDLPDKKADPDGPRHRTDDPDVLAFPATLAEYRAKVRVEAFEEAARHFEDERAKLDGRTGAAEELARFVCTETIAELRRLAGIVTITPRRSKSA